MRRAGPLEHVAVEPLERGRSIAPAGNDPDTGIINDIMEIVGGTGVFENVSGFMKNHAIVDLKTFTLTTSVHGRICADSL